VPGGNRDARPVRPPPPPRASADSDRALEIYKAVRAHELVLNEARAMVARSALGPLITLNGGAMVAFLTLLGALSAKDSGVTPNYWVAAAAIAVWGLGLLFAVMAVAAASSQQREINRGYRLMREIVEERLDNDIAAIVARVPSTEAQRREGRASARTEAEKAGRTREKWWKISATAFAVGAAIALVSILVVVSTDSARATRTTTTKTMTTAAGKRTTTTTTTTTTTGTESAATTGAR
jgi:hypothetical protein